MGSPARSLSCLSVTASAAFFDLDRTLIRRSSALALAGTFRERGLISRVDLLKSVYFQLLFAARGASAERVRFAAVDAIVDHQAEPIAQL